MTYKTYTMPSLFLTACSISASLPLLSFSRLSFRLLTIFAGFDTFRGPTNGLSFDTSISGTRSCESVKTCTFEFTFGSSKLSRVRRDLRCLRGVGNKLSISLGLKLRTRLVEVRGAAARLRGVFLGVGNIVAGSSKVLSGNFTSWLPLLC